MKHSLPLAPQFYVTASQPCPYLDDRVERKLFTGLQNPDGQALNDALSKQGFRRSQNVLYRPACADCSACVSVRVRVADFKLSKSQKRIRARNKALIRQSHSAWATEEQFELFKTYLDTRHNEGGTADMDMFEFAAMIEETPVRARIIEYREDTEQQKNRLSAACLTDVLNDGLSMVYSFFDPDISEQSPGRFMILDHVAIAQEAKLPYVYLGYWVPGSPKMDYKSKFSALEYFIDGEWQRDIDPEQLAPKLNCPATKSILEQVASMKLPDIA